MPEGARLASSELAVAQHAGDIAVSSDLSRTRLNLATSD